jgi:SAM-dependent methyltransferase
VAVATDRTTPSTTVRAFIGRLLVVQRLRRRAADFTLQAWREVVARLYLRGEGIEIGALNRPLRVPRGATVKYVDRSPVAALRTEYQELGADRLVEADIIDDGERLTTIGDRSLDFVIANHFVEHCQDPIGALANMLRVLKEGGVLYLAVPDKRYSPDRDRPVTSNEHLLRDHREGPLWSRRQHFEEWVRLWDHERQRDADAVDRRVHELMEADYSIHYHVWTAAAFMSFLLVLKGELAAGMGLECEIEHFFRNRDEVIVILRRGSRTATPEP